MYILFSKLAFSLKIWTAPREGGMTLNEAALSLSLSLSLSPFKLFLWGESIKILIP